MMAEMKKGRGFFFSKKIFFFFLFFFPMTYLTYEVVVVGMERGWRRG
jgi:hypothetical protein